MEAAHAEHRHVLAPLEAVDGRCGVGFGHQHHAGDLDLLQDFRCFVASNNRAIQFGERRGGAPGVQRRQVQPSHDKHMKTGKRGNALGAGFEFVSRQGKGQISKAERIKRHHPVQPDHFFGGQQ